MKFRNVQQVAEWRLCVGCGACVYACAEKRVELIDIENDGIRPVIRKNDCGSCNECVKVCPGKETIHKERNENSEFISSLRTGWGPVLDVWEGYAADPELRFHGSSGGLATALALYCLMEEKMYGALHTVFDAARPWKTKTVISRNMGDLLRGTGSRYSPASVCDGLEQIESAPAPCLFIGKPCDVVGLRKVQSIKSGMDRKIGAAIGIFCAGTPSTLGTLKLLDQLHVKSDELEELRYRGRGWPGIFTVRLKKEETPKVGLSYIEAWGFLQQFRPFRCYLCPDGTSEFADISCGDPWYRKIQDGETGYSLVLVRTQTGRKIVESAIRNGYVVLEHADAKILEGSQRNLLDKRRAIWGRLLAMRALGIPTPQLEGFSLFENWCELLVKEKLRSILGTARRILQRSYFRPLMIKSQRSASGDL